jgi:hypothetical protein
MNRRYLVLGAAVVLAVVLGLYVATSKGEDVAAKREPDAQKIPENSPGHPAIRMTQTPSAGADRPVMAAGSGAAVSDYTVGNVRIRDHRSGEHAPVDIPPAIHPPEGRKIPSQLTSDLAQRLRPLVTECAATVPPEARGAKSRLEGEILIAIKNQQATVTGATFRLRDVASGSPDPVTQCMEQKSVGVAAPSGDEPDLEGYAITLSLRLP